VNRDLIKHGVLTVLLVSGWFALASLSRNSGVQSALGWVGLAVVAFYFRWILKNKLQPPKL
jgi:hypothetical protein